MTFPTVHDDHRRIVHLKAQRMKADARQQRIGTAKTMDELVNLILDEFKEWFLSRPDANTFDVRVPVSREMRERLAPQESGPDLFQSRFIRSLQALTSWDVFPGLRLNIVPGCVYTFKIRKPSSS